MFSSELSAAAEDAIERCTLGGDAELVADPPELDGVYQANTIRDGDRCTCR